MVQNRFGQATLNCNFCGKGQKEVKKLIAGPSCYICDECIELCNDIIYEDTVKNSSKCPWKIQHVFTQRTQGSSFSYRPA